MCVALLAALTASWFYYNFVDHVDDETLSGEAENAESA